MSWKTFFASGIVKFCPENNHLYLKKSQTEKNIKLRKIKTQRITRGILFVSSIKNYSGKNQTLTEQGSRAFLCFQHTGRKNQFGL